MSCLRKDRLNRQRSLSSAALVEPEKLECGVYSDLSQIAELSHSWDRLLASSACNQAFASPEWYSASCHMNKESMPYLVVAMRGEEICGLLPLSVAPDGIASFPHFGNDYNDLVVKDHDPRHAAVLLSYAATAFHGIKRLVLSRLRPDSVCLQALPLLAADCSLTCSVRAINSFPCIDLPCSFSEYLASRSKVFRKNIKRAFNKIALNGLVTEELLPNQFDALALAELFISLSISRHKQRSFLQDPAARCFVRSVMPAIFTKRSLRAFVLRKDDQVLALDLCAVRSGGFVTWNGGFLAGAEPWSPGKVLFAFGIKKAIELGLQEYDFTEGRESYKSHWTNSSYIVSEIQVFKRVVSLPLDV